MEGVDKGLFPSKSVASPNLSSTGFEENNENDSSQDNMIPKNYKKTVAKHFMSPTISAASKAAAPRNKILAERNGSSRNSGFQNDKMSNRDWKRSPRNRSDQFSSRIVDPEDDGDTKAYDPVKNFLSPRPKYLRFDPNRRREILKRVGKEELNRSFETLDVSDGEESSAEEIDDSSSSPPEESAEKTEDDEDMVDDEEEKEGRGWCLRGVLKFLLTLIGCALSTSYICSMNSPTPSQTQQEIWHVRDGCLMIKNQTLEFVSMKMPENGFFGVEVGDKYSEVEDVLVDEDDDGGKIKESFEAEIVENLEGHEKELGRNDEIEDSKDDTDKGPDFVGAAESGLIADNFEQLIAAKSDGTVDAIDFSYTSSNEENMNKEDEGAEIEIKVELIGSKTDESEDSGGYVAMETEAPNEFQDSKLSAEPISEERQVESEMVNEESTDLVDEELSDAVNEVDEIGYDNEDAKNNFQDSKLSPDPISEETQVESKVVDESSTVPVDEELSDSVNEVDEIGYDNEDVKVKTTWITSVVIGVLAVSIILTSLSIIYHSKKGRSTPAESSKPMSKPHMLVVEEATPLVPCIERKVEFLARPSSSSYPSMEEAPKVMNRHIHAPSVELISEIVVGKASSSLKTSEKYDSTGSNLRNTTFFVEPASLPHSFSTPIKPSTEEQSTTSHGSFTTERKKILKKEGGERGEAMIGVTPVRRSNRLRNRAAVTSP